MGQAGYSDASIINYLQGIEFPATRQDMIDLCEDVNAPPQVMSFIEKMPDREYDSWMDLMESAGELHGKVV